MAAMRERAIILLDVTGLGLLVAGAWSTWGIGAGEIGRASCRERV